MEKYEPQLHQTIKTLFEEIKDMKPEGGFSSPRDLELVKEVNEKTDFMDKLQEAMRVINPDYEIRD